MVVDRKDHVQYLTDTLSSLLSTGHHPENPPTMTIIG